MITSFIHSTAWERFQKKAGAITIRSGDLLFIERRSALASYWLGSRLTIPAGFQVPDFARSACFLRLEPLDEASLAELKKLGPLHPTVAVQPRQTSLVDIKPDLKDILAAMKSKHRYNIRVAEKHGVEVEIHSQNPSGQFERFWKLLTTTADRHDFRTHAKEYYRTMVEELSKDGMVHLLIAKQGETDLAGLILITYQDTATYLHGGSTTLHKEMMAPYKLHAEAIQFAKNQGCTLYDLWGTDLAFNENKQAWEPKTGSSSAGTSRFKLGFGGRIITYPGTFDLVLQPFRYKVYTVIRALRARKRSFS